MDRSALALALDRMRVPEAAMALRRMARVARVIRMARVARAASPWLTVLTYHRIAPPNAAAVLDAGVVDARPDQFERQIAFVRRWFHPLTIDDLLEHVSGTRPLPPNPLLITFDDGYRDNHDVALPILLRQGVPATFFVATDFVERRRPFWWDKVARILKGSPRDRIVLRYPDPAEWPLAGERARVAAVAYALRIIKNTHWLDLDRFLAELQRAAGFALGASEERRMADETVMTWDHVSALRRAGMGVQSHTRTHRVLQTLHPAQLADELDGSRRALENVLGERVRAISYPVGRPLRGVPNVREAVRSAGYELGFSNGTGVNSAVRLDPLDLRRLSLDGSLDDSFFRTMLALPWLAY
jgi:peptidoglycan/xylan/chitin deacetylase (PgdA/CDA1 family)